MISIYDLYDMGAIFKLIRLEINYEKNIDILRQINEVLLNQSSYESNQIRRAVANITNLNHENWGFVYKENTYVYDDFVRNKAIINILNKVCDELIVTLELKKYNIAYDLIDTIHCLPIIIANNHFSIPKSYWKSHIKYYRKKWNKSFLKSEQKSIYRN